MNKILILVVLFGCTNYNTTESKELKVKKEEKYQTTNEILNNGEEYLTSELKEFKIIENELKLIYLNSVNSFKTQILRTDSFRYQVYITLNSEKLNNNMSVTIDSINMFEPIKTTIIHSDELAMGGYLTDRQSYSLSELIKFVDINRDSKDDVLVYNPLVSGNGHNTCYNVFLNKQTKYEYSDEFTKPNLKYNEESKTYTDWSYGGMAGHDYSTRTYINKYDTLIMIKHERQEFDHSKELFIRTIEDLVTGEIEIEEIKHER